MKVNKLIVSPERPNDGIIIYESNSKYVGGIKKLQRNGFGIMKFSANYSQKNKIKKIFAEFKDDELDISKPVKIEYINEETFVGFITLGKKKELDTVLKNKGIEKTQSGEYIGEWKDDKKSGNGKSIESKSTYSGEFQNGLKHGFGVMKFTNDRSTKIISIWKNDLPNCKHSKIIFDSQYTKKKEEKKFVIQSQEKEKKKEIEQSLENNTLLYKGEIRNGIISGKGEMHYKNGAKYFGEFKYKQKSGFGQLRWKSIEVIDGKKTIIENLYQGNFENDKFSGFGLHLKGSNEVFIGTFKNNKKSGMMEHYFFDSKRYYYGIFENDLPKVQNLHSQENKRRFFLQSGTKDDTVITVDANDNSLILEKKRGTRNQLWYFENGNLRSLFNNQVIENYNNSIIMAKDRFVSRSVQIWFYDGNSFFSYYDKKKLVCNNESEFGLVEFDKESILHPLRSKKFNFKSIHNNEFLTYSKEKVIKTIKGFNENKLEQCWLMLNGTLVNQLNNKELIYDKKKDSLSMESFEIIQPSETKKWFYDGDLLIWNLSDVLTLDNKTLKMKPWKNNVKDSQKWDMKMY